MSRIISLSVCMVLVCLSVHVTVRASPSTAVSQTFWGLSTIADVAVSSGDVIWAVEQNNHNILKFGISGVLIQEYYIPYTLGSPPTYVGIAYDSTNNYIWFNSETNVYYLDNNPGGGTISTLTTSFGGARGICTDINGFVYIVFPTAIQKIDASETSSQIFEITIGTPLIDASDCFVDSDQNLFVADTGNDRIVKLGSDGTFIRDFTGLRGPTGVEEDSGGNLYITEKSNSDVVKLDSTGGIVATYSGSLNGPIKSALDSIGTLWVADYNANVIKALDGTGTVVQTIARVEPDLYSPNDMVWDSGNIWVGDQSARLFLLDGTTGAQLTMFPQFVQMMDLTPTGGLAITDSLNVQVVVINKASEFIQIQGTCV